jgi:uncharacterized BrkB/YihY/UPF0761 family membrane protein
MDPIYVIIVLALVGVGLWAINTYLPLQPPFKTIINVVALIATVLWLLAGFGLFNLAAHRGP